MDAFTELQLKRENMMEQGTLHKFRTKLHQSTFICLTCLIQDIDERPPEWSKLQKLKIFSVLILLLILIEDMSYFMQVNHLHMHGMAHTGLSLYNIHVHSLLSHTHYIISKSFKTVDHMKIKTTCKCVQMQVRLIGQSLSRQQGLKKVTCVSLFLKAKKARCEPLCTTFHKVN